MIRLQARRRALAAFGMMALGVIAAGDSPALQKSPATRLNWPMLHAQLQTGDLVYRSGLDAVSRASRLGDGLSGQFSHVGVVEVGQGDWWVWHAVPAEGTTKGGLVRERLSDFWGPTHSADHAWQSTGALLPNGAQQGLAFARAMEGTPFDERFNRHDPSTLYCTEFAGRFLVLSGMPLELLERTITLPWLELELITVGELIRSVESNGLKLKSQT